MRIEPFGAGRPAPARELARLHAVLLPTSPVVRLGPGFMERCYYRLLPRADLLFGALARVDGVAAGLVVATAAPAGFMRAALRRWPVQVFGRLGLAILQAPLGGLPALLEAQRIQMGRQPAGGRAAEGEILTLGVLPDFASGRFVREHRVRLGQELLGHALEGLRARGVARVHAIVDADNLAAKLFYHAQGWRLEATSVPGWRVPSVDYLIDLREGR